jgi:hypothetical protein
VAPERDDHESDFITAKERDLQPLVRESEGLLGLTERQVPKMSEFLDQAWRAGTRASRGHLLAREQEPDADARPFLRPLESEFKHLLLHSADTLNLSVPATLLMWDFLRRALIAGIYSAKGQHLARVIETETDVAREAMRWLEDRDSDS